MKVQMQTLRSGRWTNTATLVVKRELPRRWVTLMDGREVEWSKADGLQTNSMDRGVRVVALSGRGEGDAMDGRRAGPDRWSAEGRSRWG